MSDGKLKGKYALFCSVPDDTPFEKLSEFSQWFLSNVTKEAVSIGMYYDFEDAPTIVTRILPGDLEGCVTAYEKLHKEYPSVQLVLHILPGCNSLEHDWMKALAARYGVVRQGVLLENALNHFENAEDLRTVFRNVSQWFSRALHNLWSSKNLSERAFDIRVGNSTPCSNTKSYNPHVIQSAVTLALHGSDPSVCREESAVKVEGFSNGLNEFGVSQLFQNLCVTGVSFTPNGAIVTFVNKFHAYQACALNNSALDRIHTLRVHPLSQEVSAQLEVTERHHGYVA